jgi:hypothetical protein
MPATTASPPTSSEPIAAPLRAWLPPALFGGDDPAVAARRSFMSEGQTLNRQLLAASSKGGTATLKATFEMQNAMLAAGISVIDAFFGASTPALHQWQTAAREQQKVMLEAWESGTKAVQEMMPTTPEAR